MYDHFIAIDWAQSNMAIARLTKKTDRPSDIGELKTYLKSLRGKKILTFEETTGSLWLNTELSCLVNKVLVCDPTRNRFLSEGAKTDKIDAVKLVQLLKSDLLKEVYQPCESYAQLRQLTSYYDDVVKAGVRIKNQLSAIQRSKLSESSDFSITQDLEQAILSYETRKKSLEKVFQANQRKFKEIEYLQKIPGIGLINSTKIVAKIVDPGRFPSSGHFLSYCGLIKLDRISGGKTYRKKLPRYCREMKSAFKTAALSALQGRNSFSKYYENLVETKRMPSYQARHAVARKIAIVTLKTLKERKSYIEKNKDLWNK